LLLFLIQRPLEIAQVLRDALLDEVSGPALGFLLLILIVEIGAERVMHVVRLDHEIGERKLQLVGP